MKPTRQSSTTLRTPLIVLGVLVCIGALVAAYAFIRNRESTNNAIPLPADNSSLATQSGPWFEDVSAKSGIDFTYHNGEEKDLYTILESLGGGVGLLDFDRDGLLDIVLTGGGGFDGPAENKITGLPTKIYRNLGKLQFADVTAAIELLSPPFYSHGCAVADYDRDGWPDFLITGFGQLALYHNQAGAEGQRRFVEVSAAAGLRDNAWCSSAGWGDIDGDGDPDLYVCHYLDWTLATDKRCETGGRRDVCPPQRFPPLRHALFENRGDGTFVEITAQSSLRSDGCGLGVIFVDLNNDAKPDIYVANDATNNHLYLNRGGKLEERAQAAGVAVDQHGLYNGSMGVDAADYDGVHRPSLLVTNFHGEVHALYENLGKEQFDHRSNAAGLAALGRRYVGFGTGFFDANNDGWEDLVVANGHVLRYPLGAKAQQRAVLMQNVAKDDRRFFVDVSKQGGPYFQSELLGRGLAIGDLDNDGWQDLVISHTNSPVVLLRNVAAATQPRAWLGVELIGKNYRDLAGSTVTLEVGDQRLTRYVKGGGSYLSSGDRRIVCGLGDAKAVGKLTVQWSWGDKQEWSGLKPNSYYRLTEGEAEAVQR
jgi:hypothetical protein